MPAAVAKCRALRLPSGQYGLRLGFNLEDGRQ